MDTESCMFGIPLKGLARRPCKETRGTWRDTAEGNSTPHSGARGQAAPQRYRESWIRIGPETEQNLGNLQDLRNPKGTMVSPRGSAEPLVAALKLAPAKVRISWVKDPVAGVVELEHREARSPCWAPQLIVRAWHPERDAFFIFMRS